MSAVVVVGAQWGDEGKGKVVDLYTPYAELVVRTTAGWLTADFLKDIRRVASEGDEA